MNRSATIRLGSAPGTTPSIAGAKLPAEAEANALIAVIPSRSMTGKRNRALVTMLYRGGLRIAEALALKPSDVDPDRGTVRILRGKGAKPRTIGLEPGALATVQRWLDARKAAGIRDGVLFCTISSDAGQPLSRQYVSMMLKRQAAKAGIDKRVHPHGLRHTLTAKPGAISPPSRQRSSVSTWSPGPWTQPGPAAPGGATRWKPALNAFAITFGDRFPAAETY
jgi:site-specific recombinase XerC